MPFHVFSRGPGGIFEGDPRFADVAEAPPDVPIETPRHETPYRRGRRRGEFRHVDALTQHRRERVRDVLALERALTRQHFVEDRAERPHVAALVSRPPFRLLRTHIRGGAEDHADLRHRRTGDRRRRCHVAAHDLDRFERLRKAEVQHLHGAVRPHLDIRRLEIAVDDPLLVCGFEGFRDLPRDRQRIVDGNRPLRDAIGERGPLDQLQHERLDAVRFFKAVDRGDVRMVERREHLRLALEAREPIGIAREELGKDLQRDITIELRVTRTIDLAHAACAECRDRSRRRRGAYRRAAA